MKHIVRLVTVCGCERVYQELGSPPEYNKVIVPIPPTVNISMVLSPEGDDYIMYERVFERCSKTHTIGDMVIYTYKERLDS
jgi:hypothetical protein